MGQCCIGYVTDICTTFDPKIFDKIPWFNYHNMTAFFNALVGVHLSILQPYFKSQVYVKERLVFLHHTAHTSSKSALFVLQSQALTSGLSGVNDIYNFNFRGETNQEKKHIYIH